MMVDGRRRRDALRAGATRCGHVEGIHRLAVCGRFRSANGPIGRLGPGSASLWPTLGRARDTTLRNVSRRLGRLRAVGARALGPGSVGADYRYLPRSPGASTPMPVVRLAVGRLCEVPESLEIESFGRMIREFTMTIPMPFVGHRTSPPSYLTTRMARWSVDSVEPLIVANPATPEE